MTKICYLITSLDTGGAEVALRTLVRGLDRSRFSVVVVSIRPVGAIGVSMREDGVRVLDLGLSGKFDPRLFTRLYSFLKKEEPDILHTFLSHSNIIGRVVGRMAGVPRIVSSIQNDRFGGRIRERLMQWTDGHADVTAIVSRKAADRMLRIGVVSPERSLVVYNGVDFKSFPLRDKPARDAVRAALSMPEDAPVVISVGRLAEQKGYPYLLEAFALVRKNDPKMILLDEPSEGIQPNIVQDIARIMVELNRKTGVSIVFVEQNIDMIRAMAQRCHVMDKGRIVAELTPAQLNDDEVVRRHLAV